MWTSFYLAKQYVEPSANALFKHGCVYISSAQGKVLVPLLKGGIRENERALDKTLSENGTPQYRRYRVQIDDGRYGLCAMPQKDAVCTILRP
jgi:hypothetical protein